MDTRKFYIKPQIPEKISQLEDLSRNIWSYWDKDAERLFHRLDPKLFRKLNHNPIELLYKISEERLIEASKDKGFLYELQRVYDKFENYMQFEGTCIDHGKERPFSKKDVVLYTCMEYGLHESLSFYSGGLAVLAGDQLKAASDIGIPMVGFGLLYKHGYFTQRIATDGVQLETFQPVNWQMTPIQEVYREDGSALFIDIPLKDRKVIAKLWRLDVGKIPLYLLDTNIHQNPGEIRNITHMLYDADRARRIEQELVLGRGAIIALKALSIEPKIYHMNEGHTAFSILQRLLNLTAAGRTLNEASAIIRSSTVFTTHTPVVEGNEHFSDDRIREYLKNEVAALGLDMKDFLSLGKIGDEKLFWLPAFALRFSMRSNGVSKLHGEVSRRMWKNIFPTCHQREYPIQSVTNGVHLQSWLSLQITELFDRYIGPDYFHSADSDAVWKNIESIPDGEIWNAHCRRKEQVISFIRRRLVEAMQQRGYAINKITDIEQFLNPAYLTIGFARRFAPYKRACLIFTDPERLAAILTNEDRPVQIVFSGKAHPADEEGKKNIAKIFEFIEKYPVRNHIVFIEDYDINIARHLVQGMDVWLNTPIKYMEASGTSGMKAGINGCLNLSVLDGWWPEAYNGKNGWAISAGENIDDSRIANHAEANQLYELLENDITKLFYNKNEDTYPHEWVAMMKDSILTTCRGFNMHRAVRQYIDGYYQPQKELSDYVADNDYLHLKGALKTRGELDKVWNRIYLKDYFTSIDGKMPFTGETVSIDAYIYLDNVDPSLIRVESFYCNDDADEASEALPLNFIEKYQDGVAKYTGTVVLRGNGSQEIGVRIVPASEEMRIIYPEYMKWKA